MNNEVNQDVDVIKEQIRSAVAGYYDLQKLRISSGNRLVANFYRKLGIKPSESPNTVKENDKELSSMLNNLTAEYKRLTDGIICNKAQINKRVSELDKSENPLRYIRDVQDYSLMKSYILLLDSEKVLESVVEGYVTKHPMWDAFFKDVSGCGTKISAICLAYLDPYKARHVSSFFRYAGLDTVQNKDKEGNRLFLTTDGSNKLVRESGTYLSDGSAVYLDENGDEYIGEVVVSEHGRRKGDTEMFEYTSRDGSTELKRGITYNPILKCSLVGKLADCFIKCSTRAENPKYANIYYDYRKRLDNSAYHKDYTDGHKNMMAKRYMIKQFLRDLWVTWRTLEGLPVDNPYEVEKLGHAPHKYNQYQCDTARKSIM